MGTPNMKALVLLYIWAASNSTCTDCNNWTPQLTFPVATTSRDTHNATRNMMLLLRSIIPQRNCVALLSAQASNSNRASSATWEKYYGVDSKHKLFHFAKQES